MQRMGLGISAAILAMTTVRPAAADGPPPPPAQWAQLYQAVAGTVQGFAAKAPSCPGNTMHPQVFADLLGADANYIQSVLPQADPTRMAALVASAIGQAQTLRDRFGVAGVETQINYPVLVENPANLPDNGTLTTQYYSKYLQFYEAVAAGVRALGLKLAVETHLNFPGLFANFSYQGITLNQLNNGEHEVGQHVLDHIKPDYMELWSEPSTEAELTGLKALDQPDTYADFIVKLRQRLDTDKSPLTLITAGSGDWLSQDFLKELVERDAAAQKHLDMFDLHAYPPGSLTALTQDLDYLVGQGKLISMSETWDNKQSPQIQTPSGPQFEEVINGYSFWEGVDAQYVTALYQYLDCSGARFVNYWHSPQFSAYVDYNAQTANYTSKQMQQALDQAVKQAAANNTVSLTGAAIRALTGFQP
jgi:hypothetical protein